MEINIWATLGPKSKNANIIKSMIDNSCSCFRLNLSHGDYESHQEYINLIRNINKDFPILLDLKGPEIRVRESNGENVFEGDYVFISYLPVSDKCICPTYKDFNKALSIGKRIFIDDGKIEMEIVDWNENISKAKVIVGGKIEKSKSINIPNFVPDIPMLSEEMKNDLLFGIKNNISYFLISFVRNSNDVKFIREFLKNNGGENIKLIAKIECQKAIDNIKEISESSDGIMIARGDLGVEVGIEKVPLIQKEILHTISTDIKSVATQIFPSMINSKSISRSDVSDLVNMLIDGCNTVLFTNETAMGDYPIEVVKKARFIIDNYK